MKANVWTFLILLLCCLASLIALEVIQIRAADRPSFVALPHSVVLAPADSAAPPAVDPQLAGLTADDVVRGLLLLSRDRNTPLDPAQITTLAPLIRQMRENRHRLLTLRQQRHEHNEAAMEDTLESAALLDNDQLQRTIGGRREEAPRRAAQEEWATLLRLLENE